MHLAEVLSAPLQPYTPDNAQAAALYAPSARLSLKYIISVNQLICFMYSSMGISMCGYYYFID